LNFNLKKNFLFKFGWILIICLVLSSIPGRAEEKSDHLVITSADIEKMNVRSMPDLLNQVPGIKAGESSVTIQGSYKVKVFLDNRPINDPASTSSIKWSQVSVSSVEKIEIRKGGGGVEYGEDSGGGVILITTKQSNKFQFDIETYAGNMNTQSYSANCQANAGMFNIGTSFGYEKDDGYRTNDDQEKTSFGLRLNYNSGSHLSLQPGFSYYLESKGMAGFVGHETPKYRNDYETYSITLIAKLKSIKSKTYFDDVTRENENPDVPLYFGMDIRKFGQEITSPISLGRWGTMNMGMGLEYAEAEGSLPEKVSEEKYFLFVAHKIKLGQSPVSLYSGLRGVYYTKFQNAINPEVRFIYNKERWSVQAGFGMVDNTPTFLQRFNRTTVTLPNPDLEIEKVKNYTIAFFNQIAENLSLNVSAYYSEVTNRISNIIFYDNAGNLFATNENVGKAILQGVDTTINWKPSKLFSLNILYSFIDAKDADADEYLPVQPVHKAQISLLLVPVENLSVAITSEYFSKHYTRKNEMGMKPEYYLTNCRVEYRFDKVNAFGEVKNLFDEDYIPGSGYPGEPTTWIMGFNYTF